MAEVNNGSGMLFSFAEMRREIENMAGMARNFLEPATTEWIIPEWRLQLENFATSPPEAKLAWQIQLGKPVQTIQSIGEYEPGNGGALTIFGTLSSVWEI